MFELSWLWRHSRLVPSHCVMSMNNQIKLAGGEREEKNVQHPTHSLTTQRHIELINETLLTSINRRRILRKNSRYDGFLVIRALRYILREFIGLIFVHVFLSSKNNLLRGHKKCCELTFFFHYQLVVFFQIFREWKKMHGKYNKSDDFVLMENLIMEKKFHRKYI